MSELCDKGWMVIEDRSSSGYRTGVDNFIKFAYNNRLRDTPFCICPCRCCRNRKSLSFALVRHDLLVNGILSTYAIWSLHGETSTDTQRSEYLTQENVEHTIVEEETLEKEIVEESHGDDGCRLNEFVDKAFGVYEGLNEDVNVDDSGHPFIQEPNLGKKHDKYKKLAEEKIYPTCENGATTLSVIVELHHVKKRFGWSGNSVTYLLGLLRKWFPEGNTFPAKYPVMKEMLKDMGMKAENIHACVNHCVLFRKDLKDEVEFQCDRGILTQAKQKCIENGESCSGLVSPALEEVFGRTRKDGIRGYSSSVSKKQAEMAAITKSALKKKDTISEEILNTIEGVVGMLVGTVDAVQGQVGLVNNKFDILMDWLKKQGGSVMPLDTPSPEKGSTSFTGVQKGRVQETEKQTSASTDRVESTNRVRFEQVELLNNMGKVVASGVIDGGGVVHDRKVKKNERKVYIEEVFDQKALIWDGPQGDDWVSLSQIPVPTWLVWSEERLRPFKE
ncbi:hypothetical protein OROMI_007228 [Orobanche minor]